MDWEVKGTFTALMTPFKRNGEIDEEGVRRLVKSQVEAGVDGIIVCGTTGEAATLSEEEKYLLARIVLNASKGQVPVIAGAGTNNTRETVAMAKQFSDIGVNGLLVVVPYYNRPTQEGMFQHFKSVAQSTDLPIIMYNIPGRTASNLDVPTVRRLVEIKNIVGLKEASGNFAQISRLIRDIGNISIVSGDDPLTLPIIALGGRGVISVASNLVPEEMTKLVNSALSNDFDEARRIHSRLLPLFEVLLTETNPAPLKMAMSMFGLATNSVRLPLVPVSEQTTQKIREILVELGLLR